MTKVEGTPKAPAVDSMTIKTFRSNADIEAFYRYIHDNDLRREAFMMIEHAISKIAKGRKGRKPKTLQ